MNELYHLFNLDVITSFKKTDKVEIINTSDGVFVIKEISLKEKNNYKLLAKYKYDYLKPLARREYMGKTFYLFPYIEDKLEDNGNNILKELNNIHKKTANPNSTNKISAFKLKKMILVMNEKFQLLELKIREVELRKIKGDVEWIILAKYYIILDTKFIIYSLLKKLEKEVKDLEYAASFLHAAPNASHFKDNKFLSFNYAKEGYFVSDIYKVYLSFESSNKNIKKEIEKYLDTPFAKKYFKLMVLYSYTILLDSIDFYKDISPYITYTNKLAKALSLFKDYK